MPPGYYLLVQLTRNLPGDPLVTLRLPSIIGYLLSLLGVYWFARRRLPVLVGLAAVILMTLSPFREYALEARSYSLLVGFLAISAALWQRIGENRFITPLFALFLTLAVSCHHLAVVAVSSFGIAELTWTLLSRRIRWGAWAACLLATSPFFLGLPIMLRFRAIFGKTFWSRPSWGMVISTYGSSYLGIDYRLAIVLIAFFGLVVVASFLRMYRTSSQISHAKRQFSPPEVILVGGFLCFPALLVVLTKLLHSGYTPRYGTPGILGLVLGSAYLFRTLCLKSCSIHLLGALLIAFAVQEGYDFALLSKGGAARLDEKRWTALAEISRRENGVPVVIGSGIRYLEAAEYAPLDLRARLVQIVDAEAATRLAGTDSVDKTNHLLAQFIPLRIEELNRFETAFPRFILLSGGDYDWFTSYLVERKYHLRLLSHDGQSQVYIAEL